MPPHLAHWPHPTHASAPVRPQAGNTTRLLRNSDAPEAAVPSAEQYGTVLQAARITLGMEERKDAIWQGVQEAAHSVGGEFFYCILAIFNYC